MTDAPEHSYPGSAGLRMWKAGRLEPCSLTEFVEGLKAFGTQANKDFGHRSDMRAHVGDLLIAAADALERCGVPAQSSCGCGDEEQPDCTTPREHELYFALMGLASAVMARRREWDNWVQGGVKVAPIVRKALRLDGPLLPSTNCGGGK